MLVLFCVLEIRNSGGRGESKMEMLAQHSHDEAQQVAGRMEVPRESSECHLPRVIVENKREKGFGKNLGDHLPLRIEEERGSQVKNS
jgi:hypothetical protein